MRILQVTSFGYIAGGAETTIRLIREELNQRGHTVKVFSADAHGPEFFGDYHFKTIDGNPAIRALNHLFYFRSYIALRKAIKDFRPDIIHFHSVAQCSPSVFFAIKNIPAVMTIHGPEEFMTELRPWLLLPGDYKNTPFDLQWSNLKPIGQFRYLYNLLLQRPLYMIAIRKVKYFIAPSKYFAKIISTDISSAKIKQIYNGIDLPSAKPLPKRKRALFVGRLEQIKGPEYLIRAFAAVVNKIPEAELYIVGDGKDRKKLEELAANIKLSDKITFRGWVKSGPPILKEYEDASLLIVPSIWPENLPTVCIEALSVGRPIVGTDIGGLPELIEDGKTGYNVPAKDTAAIGMAIQKILGSDENLLAMGKAARDSVGKFSIANFVLYIEKLYQQVLDENPNR